MRRPRKINSGLQPAPKPEVVVNHAPATPCLKRFCDECGGMTPSRKNTWSMTGWTCNICQADTRPIKADPQPLPTAACGNCGGNGYEEIYTDERAPIPRYVTVACRTCGGSGYR